MPNYNSLAPEVHVPRVREVLHPSNDTSFNSMLAIPTACYEVLPGSTISLTSRSVCRMTTPIVPVMDSCYQESEYFFVPWRLVWDDAKAFFGETGKAWYNNVPDNFEIPQIRLPVWQVSVTDDYDYGKTHVAGNNASKGYDLGSVADYFGVPVGVYSYVDYDDGASMISISALQFRAYVLIWNYYYRDQRWMDEAALYKGSATQNGVTMWTWDANGNPVQRDPLLTAQFGATPLPVCRFHDYFSSVGPEAQYGDPVHLPGTPADSVTFYPGAVGSGTITLGNVDLTNLLPLVEDVRVAFAAQRIKEGMAIYGSRYNEAMYALYGVDPGAETIQVPQYLGRQRVRVNMSQVFQTSESGDTPLGSTGAYSLTASQDHVFTRSFSEPGYIIRITHVRPLNSYSQGLDRQFIRRDLFDIYNPKMAYLGLQPVYKSEIYLRQPGPQDLQVAGGPGDLDLRESVWGYTEAWKDYRTGYRRMTGYMRPNVPSGGMNSFAVYNYGDYYDAAPTMGPQWLTTGRKNIDRSLAVSSDPSFSVSEGNQEQHQFICHFEDTLDITSPLPKFSYPGLVDHM